MNFRNSYRSISSLSRILFIGVAFILNTTVVEAQWSTQTGNSSILDHVQLPSGSSTVQAAQIGRNNQMYLGSYNQDNPIMWLGYPTIIPTVQDPNMRYDRFQINTAQSNAAAALKIGYESWSNIFRISTSSNHSTSSANDNIEWTSRFALANDGHLGLGCDPDWQYIFKANGDILVKKVVVTATGWCDYVFASDYKLRPLKDVKAYIAKEGHLPEVPSEADVTAQGQDVGEVQKVMLKKIEELTLYVIELEEQNNSLEERLNKLEE